ncbi:hypothetical protein B0J12DRAFT_652275, partial [Macrophomina phaseolina]
MFVGSEAVYITKDLSIRGCDSGAYESRLALLVLALLLDVVQASRALALNKSGRMVCGGCGSFGPLAAGAAGCAALCASSPTCFADRGWIVGFGRQESVCMGCSLHPPAALQ